MVIKSEACCPKCNTQHGFYSPLRYDAATGRFHCPHDGKHVFEEREDGFLCAIP